MQKQMVLIRLIILSISFFTISCSLSTNHSVVGKYINTFETQAIHYIELKSDSTFIHYYKINDSEKINKGTWKLKGTSNKKEIAFKVWQSFGPSNSYDCNDCMRYVELKDGELIFSYDLPKEMNFTKVD